MPHPFSGFLLFDRSRWHGIQGTPLFPATFLETSILPWLSHPAASQPCFLSASVLSLASTETPPGRQAVVCVNVCEVCYESVSSDV